MAGIDPMAAVDQKARIHPDAEVGPFAVVGPEVSMGPGCVIGAHAVIEGKVEMGAGNIVAPFACIGSAPQHTAYRGEPTMVKIGDRNHIREYVTVHRGTPEGGGVTEIGDDNFIMVSCHVAHDCRLGSRIVMANLCTLAGHVEVEDDAVFGGFVGVHQHCRVGSTVMVAAMARLAKDVPPYTIAGGEPPRFLGLNRVGLRRVGMEDEAKKALRKAYRVIFSKELSLEEGLAKAAEEYGGVAEVAHVIEFIRGSERGIVRD